MRLLFVSTSVSKGFVQHDKLSCHIMHEHFLCEQENPLWLLKEETPVGLCLFNDNSCNSI